MKTLSTTKELKDYLKQASFTSHGFVPTMGALHEGHIALIRAAKKNCDFVSVSIYINPTQFNDKKDLNSYPKNLEQDLQKLKDENVDLVFTPDYQEIYPDSYQYKVQENNFSKTLCGKNRPGHFDGVLTVVMKLLNLLRPDFAFFGEKDYQQLELVRGMTKAFFMPTEIVAVPTIREKDGLAMSSRNLKLSPQAREKAAYISKLLYSSKEANEVQKELENLGFEVDYVEEIANRRFIAASLEGVRLIDNARLQ